MRKIRKISIVGLLGYSVYAGGALATSSPSLRIAVVDQRGTPVQDAVVEIDSANLNAERITFPWRMAVAQKNLTFMPGTLIVAKGSSVAFPNLDQVRHSVYSFSKPAKFTIDLYGRDQTRTQSFPLAGTVALGCNIHDNMRGYIRVVDTPFAGKTDSNGLVTLSGLPAGSARLTVWHPRLRNANNEIAKRLVIAVGLNTQTIAVSLK